MFPGLDSPAPKASDCLSEANPKGRKGSSEQKREGTGFATLRPVSAP